jgi:hypothetical protein
VRTLGPRHARSTLPKVWQPSGGGGSSLSLRAQLCPDPEGAPCRTGRWACLPAPLGSQSGDASPHSIVLPVPRLAHGEKRPARERGGLWSAVRCHRFQCQRSGNTGEGPHSQRQARKMRAKVSPSGEGEGRRNGSAPRPWVPHPGPLPRGAHLCPHLVGGVALAPPGAPDRSRPRATEPELPARMRAGLRRGVATLKGPGGERP